MLVRARLVFVAVCAGCGAVDRPVEPSPAADTGLPSTEPPEQAKGRASKATVYYGAPDVP